jgi:glycosyltransferase involved in cell wall biosynthesis
MENRFVFVTPYYNCIDDIEKTVFSMLSQSYDTWRAILIDDMSTDGSYQRVEETIKSLPEKYREKFLHVRNDRKHGEVENTLQAVSQIDDGEVVCRLDGGDWLTENDLLHILDHVYRDVNVTVAWTAHRWSYTTQNISGPMELKPGQTVYQHPWVSSHLKTFRRVALRKVPEANFRDDNGDYVMIACDQAIFLPMMHVAHKEGKKLQFVPIVGYHYNIDLTNKNLFTSERSLRQKTSAEWIRQRGFVE